MASHSTRAPAVRAKKTHHLPPAFNARFLLPPFWPTWIVLALGWVIAQLPLAMALAVGRSLGRLSYRCAPKRRRIARANIAACFPDLSASEQDQLTQQTLEETGIGLVETLVALFSRSRHWHSMATIDGLEHLEGERGVLLVGCHMTTLEMAGRLLAHHHRFDILYRRDPNPLMAWALVRARSRFNGDSIVSVETRKLVRHLQAGRTVWYAPDQDYGRKHSLFAPWFGVSAATVPGTGHFARLGNARVVFFSHYRDANNHYHITLTPAAATFPSGDDARDCAYINAQFEAMIRRAPAQYLWVHRRFKTRPPGAPDIYAKTNELETK